MAELNEGCKIECDENGCRVECGGQEVEKIEEVSGCQPSVADVVRGTTYARVEDFEVALARVAESEMLNMADDWKVKIARVWENHQCCVCAVGHQRCPCGDGIAQAKRPGGRCHCSLFRSPDE